MAQVLVVEDSAALRQLVGLIVRREGHDVTLVHDLPEALLALRGSAPDLLILDLNLPSGSGLELLPTLLAGSQVLLLSGMKQESVLSDARRQGVHDQLSKPFAPAELLNKVRGLLHAALVGAGVKVAASSYGHTW